MEHPDSRIKRSRAARQRGRSLRVGIVILSRYIACVWSRLQLLLYSAQGLEDFRCPKLVRAACNESGLTPCGSPRLQSREARQA